MKLNISNNHINPSMTSQTPKSLNHRKKYSFLFKRYNLDLESTFFFENLALIHFQCLAVNLVVHIH